MQTTSPPLGRPADRSNFIVSELRSQIVRGFLSPGSQLPTRVEIEKRYSASTITVQRALETLRQDGFVQVNGRQGTFVAENPPHLTRYALVFPEVPNGNSWLRFWTALNNEALNMPQNRDCKLRTYYGLDGSNISEDYDRLVADVRAHRVAGLIFATSPHRLQGTPLLDEPDIPRVAILSNGPWNGIARVWNDTDSFFQRALAYFKARGHRKIGFITPTGLEDKVEALVEQLTAEGFECPPIWRQTFHVLAPHTAKNAVHLMMHPRQAERPDALLISDDNLAEFATAGLISAGVRFPDDVELVVHCNFPYPAPSVVPTTRLGFDTRETLRACIENIDAQRRGPDFPRYTTISAKFEDEISATTPFGVAPV